MKRVLINFIFVFVAVFSFLKGDCLLDDSFIEESFELNSEMTHHHFLKNWLWPWTNDRDHDPEDDDIKDPKEESLNPFTPENIVGLEEELLTKIIGQKESIRTTVSVLESYAYGLRDPYAPIATLLYVGPAGVGKTELAKELAKTIFGNEQSLIRLNMSEYKGDGSIFRLIGTPRGYEGHKDGGEFTEQLKNNPYAIVLLDEIEKADPEILKVFLQLFDEGLIYDAGGTLIDCRNMLFILTSNLEGLKILTMHDLGHSDQEILDAIQPSLMRALSPELYSRLTPVVFRGLKKDVIERVIQKMLFQTADELLSKTGIDIAFDRSVVHFLKENGADYQLGARPFKLLIKQTVLTAITEAFKQRYCQKKDHFCISFDDNHFMIQNPKTNEPFTWRWKNEKEGIRPPFKLDDLLHLENKLQQKVLGQPYAIKITVASLMRYSAGLANGKSPIGAFLYVGPTGVGKTQLAKELAIELMGNESHLIRLDMSEYSDSHSISRLIGSPPGYVNHEEGGSSLRL